eukprot:CAMPEP_0198222326 /NCGR_PEP_ID=MMETSP1445-20131203/87586_1 /TAXON_ID=36898 /ORGANISM="Pyramimonas sp., Strain CCMP2087" /LENGTH=70 /DNA_ID=CAMNT_0043900777 /DNA_START=396 /DNA_END=609 /DNA_ORIENTATION=+
MPPLRPVPIPAALRKPVRRLTVGADSDGKVKGVCYARDPVQNAHELPELVQFRLWVRRGGKQDLQREGVV